MKADGHRPRQGDRRRLARRDRQARRRDRVRVRSSGSPATPTSTTWPAATSSPRSAGPGDAIQLQADNPDIQFVMPEQGCIIWADNMVIPVGAPNPDAAYEFMNYVYDPQEPGADRRLQQLHDAGRRRPGDLREDGSGAGQEPADLPDRAVPEELLDRSRSRRDCRRPRSRRPSKRCARAADAAMRAWAQKQGDSLLPPAARPALAGRLLRRPDGVHVRDLPVRGIAGHDVRVHLELGQLLATRSAPTTPSSCARSSTPASRRSSACCSPTRSPTRSRSRPASGRPVLLFLVVAPFFTTYLIRTYAWQTILSNDSVIVDVLRTRRARRRPHPEDARGRDRRAHLQLPPVHDPADLRVARADRQAADRGGTRPLLLVARRRSARSPCRSRCRASSRARS